MHLEKIQAKRVHTYGKARKAHCRCADHRVHLKRPSEQRAVEAGRKRDTYHVIKERPEEILRNVSDRRS